MSTTGAFGFRIEGQDKVAFHGSDAHPSGLGTRFLTLFNEVGYYLMNNLAKGIVLVDSERYYDELHFPFSRFEKQARGLVEIADGREHLLKPQIEWAYIMNFDEGVFETYSGLNGIRVKNARGRYSSLFMPETPHIPGVRLIHEMFLLNVNGESVRDYASDIDKITGGLINESEFKGMSFYEIDKIWKQRYAAEQAK